MILLSLLIMYIFRFTLKTAANIVYSIKINNLLESINDKDDLSQIGFGDFVYLMMEVFRRKGYKVKMTDKCGEENNGLILNNLQYVEVIKFPLNKRIEVETAMKLARCMQLNSIYRGMIVTLGDFKQNTRSFCHKYVIECINGDKVLEMCKEVQKRRPVLETNQPF
ncbi:MAG TPA: hypothetical protein GXX36_06375 [Clostridiaceae bacterium]|nr:hypothetical protein [Clostridiaceae bacterium]